MAMNVAMAAEPGLLAVARARGAQDSDEDPEPTLLSSPNSARFSFLARAQDFMGCTS